MTGHAATEPAAQRWDAIVIGTGVGGATLGYALARAGWKVLFCEKGKSNLGSAEAIRAAYPETCFARPEMPAAKHRAILAAAGRYCDELEDASRARHRAFVPFIGSGTGGSSALYGMAMERFFPSDFTADGRDRDSETTLPERWPISYADLAPYYRSAEALYRVRGDADPLRADQTGGALGTPPALSAAGTELL